jgi:ribosomal protein L22
LDYETSIDKDVYNQVKLYKDNKTTGKRELYIVNDTINGGKTLKAWGLLQFTEKLKENLTFSQIENRALAYLKYYNSVKRKLKLTSLGVPTVRAGSIFRCKIQALGDISVDSYLLVTESVHKFYDSYTEMELTTEVIDNEW